MLYYIRFRYYDCEAGQYISADPIGLAGGLNFYRYMSNSLSWIDPLGLTCCSPNKKTTMKVQLEEIHLDKLSVMQGSQCSKNLHQLQDQIYQMVVAIRYLTTIDNQ